MNTMKKTFVMLMVMVLVLVGCGPKEEPAATAEETASEASTSAEAVKEDALNVVFVCNGTLGDKSFMDSAAEGIYKMQENLDVNAKIIEAGFDKTKWLPALEDAADSDYDVIIVGTWEMQEPLEEVAPMYPDKKFIIFDTTMDYSSGDYDNVYSIAYRYNEESFLAGALAALVTSSDMELANQEAANIGFIGGIDSPVINDYLVGYVEGAKYINPDITVSYSYIGDFSNSTKGKEMAIAQYASNDVDVIFAAAGQAGLGAIDAAKDEMRYTIGVDGDQAQIFAETDMDKANKILTSAVSNVGNSLYDAMAAELETGLEWGSGISTGIMDGTAELVDNEFYQELVPDDFRKQIEDIENKIATGEITVQSAIGMEASVLEELLSSVSNQ